MQIYLILLYVLITYIFLYTSQYLFLIYINKIILEINGKVQKSKSAMRYLCLTSEQTPVFPDP